MTSRSRSPSPPRPACPALFHPLSISGLYSGIRVQLVDGGVHDNQGLQGLFDSDCTHLIVSDASGQLTDQPLPATRIPGVGGRANSILADRVRDEQLAHASERPQPIALMHLRKGLVGEVSLPLADDGKPVEDAPKEKLAVKPLAGDFGISMDAQRLLSRVRTDLDSFSDTEAFALMLDAYSMTDFVLNRDARFAEFLAKSPPVGSPVPERWDFRAVEEQTGAAILPAGVPSPAGGRPAAVLQADLAGAARGHGPEGDRCGDPDRARRAARSSAGADVMDALSTEWPIWWLLLGLGLPLLLVVLYVKERGPFFVRWPGLALVSYLMPIVFAPLLWLYSLVAVYVSTPIFNRLGRVRPSSARDATRHGSQSAPAPR